MTFGGEKLLYLDLKGEHLLLGSERSGRSPNANYVEGMEVKGRTFHHIFRWDV